MTTKHHSQAHLPIQGAFDLKATALVGFGHRAEKNWDGIMRLAFVIDDPYTDAAGIEVRQDGQRLDLTLTTAGDADRAAAQVARVLSVHLDGRPFAELARRDPVVGALHTAGGGLRPPQFYSPYEAAAWSILSARRSAAQGRVLRQRLSEQLGTRFELAGQPIDAFPTPERLVTLTELQGLPQASVPRLHAIAQAAMDGHLAPERLLAMDPDEARLDLQQLPGIGPFYSGLIVYRALGLPDALPLIEPRSRAALERLAGVEQPLSDAEFEALAERWRPFRMWMAFLARAVGERAQPLA